MQDSDAIDISFELAAPAYSRPGVVATSGRVLAAVQLASRAGAGGDEQEERRRAEFEHQLELEAEAAAAHLGSIRGDAAADEDEFDFDPGKAAEADPTSTQRSQPEAETEAAAAAPAEEQPLADLKESSNRALRAVQKGFAAAAASAAEPAPPAAHSAKSAAERADDLAAAQRHGSLNLISEDQEEEAEAEEDATREGPPVAPPAEPLPGAAATGGDGRAAGALAPPAHAAGPDAPAAEARRAAEESQRAALEAQWAAVEQASALEAERAAQRAEAPLGARAKGDKIGFAEALSHIEAEEELASFAAVIVREDWSKSSCLPRLVPLFRPRLRGEHLHVQRDMLMCAAKLGFDGAKPAHERILMSVFKSLTGNSRDPPRYGAHWELVGFQGADPTTDLRGVGMLSLLNALFLATRQRELAQALYALSRSECDFPFMAVSINLTRICLDALRCGALTPAANARNSVVEAFHELHCGLYAHMGEQWRARSLTIRDFGHVLNELQELGTKHAAAALKARSS